MLSSRGPFRMVFCTPDERIPRLMRRARLDALDIFQHGLAEMADRFRHQRRPLVLRPEHDGFGETLRNPRHHVAEVDAVLALDALAYQFVNVAVQAIAHRKTP